MAQFSLPQNSKIEVGNYFKDKTNSKNLKKINILNEFTNPENATVVELLLEDDSHHHHLFCSDCGEIIDIQMGDEFEKTLSKEIKRIEKKFNFSIEDHRLELFGKCTNLCENCS